VTRFSRFGDNYPATRVGGPQPTLSFRGTTTLLLSVTDFTMHGVACRCLVIPEATAWLYAPLPNFSIEQWRMMVIVAGYTLFVTSQYDIIFTFANQRSGEVYW